MLKDFKAFIMRGNVIDMAVGIIIGAAFGTVVTSLVKDIIMPPISLALGRVDFSNLFALLKAGPTDKGPYLSLNQAQAAGAVTENYGAFIITVFSFLIIAFVIFLLIRAIMKMRSRAEAPKVEAVPTTKDCPYCLSKIAIKATRCPNCTSQLQAS
jgi:large conductance mechanosensitive channel